MRAISGNQTVHLAFGVLQNTPAAAEYKLGVVARSQCINLTLIYDHYLNIFKIISQHKVSDYLWIREILPNREATFNRSEL